MVRTMDSPIPMPWAWPGERPLTTKLRWHGPVEPQSLAEHLQAAIARVPDLSPRQCNAIMNVMLEKCRDLSFVKMVMDQTPGWSRARWTRVGKLGKCVVEPMRRAVTANEAFYFLQYCREGHRRGG